MQHWFFVSLRCNHVMHKFLQTISVVFIFLSSACINIEQQPEQNTSLKNTSDYQSRYKQLQQSVRELKQLVQHGDLVTRTGTDVISASFCNFNKQDKSYSHSGVVMIEQGDTLVYHLLSGEENPGDCMLKEPFDSFCDPTKKNGIGLFRYQLNDAEMHKFDSLIHFYYSSKLKFDKKFNLKDDTEMYCAELIAKSVEKATANRITIPVTSAKNFSVKDKAFEGKTYKEFKYIAVDNLYLNPFCKEIKRISLVTLEKKKSVNADPFSTTNNQ